MSGDLARVRVTGPLTECVPGFAQELRQVGYTANAACDQVRLLAHPSRWLAGEALNAAQLTRGCATHSLQRRAAGYRLWLSRKGLAPLLRYLRALGAAPPEPVAPLDATGMLLARSCDHLASKRGLKASTRTGYCHFVRRFLRMRAAPDGTLRLADLTPVDITDFVVANVPGRATGSAKLTVAALRSLLCFLHVDGVTLDSLTAAVPSVAGSRLAGLPRALEADQVQRLLAACDRRTAVGRRDFAVLTMLARLGVRSGEVAALELGDIDWRAGAIVVHKKGDRRETLLLPVDADSRHIFLRV